LGMKYLHQFFKSIEWWRLIPAQEVIAGQPGKDDASKFIATARWYHPRTGGWLDAGKVAKPRQTFKTADKNDWILLIAAE